MKKYIAGPDVNTGEKEMQWFVEAVGNLRAATGKPSKLCHPSGERCGLPHELGSTGFGVAQGCGHRHQDEGFGHKANDSGDRRLWQCWRIHF